MKAKGILIGVALVYGLTFIGGFFIGVAAGVSGIPPAFAALAMMLSNLVLSTVGFCIAGALVKTERFKSLLVVALVCWLLSALNMLIIPTYNTLQWVVSLVFILVTMGIGGGLSYLFASAPTESSVPAV